MQASPKAESPVHILASASGGEMQPTHNARQPRVGTSSMWLQQHVYTLRLFLQKPLGFYSILQHLNLPHEGLSPQVRVCCQGSCPGVELGVVHGLQICHSSVTRTTWGTSGRKESSSLQQCPGDPYPLCCPPPLPPLPIITLLWTNSSVLITVTICHSFTMYFILYLAQICIFFNCGGGETNEGEWS